MLQTQSRVMADFKTPVRVPQRKPVPPRLGGGANLQPLSPIQVNDQRITSNSHPQAHARTRTSSSAASLSVTSSPRPHPNFTYPTTYTTVASPPPPPNCQSVYPQPAIQYTVTNRRTPSNATQSTSTTGTGGRMSPGRNPSYTSSNLRRTSSSRSGQANGYVAAMRKQKGTVWCDRAQHEDPRWVAQQKAAKSRAAIEVMAGTNRSSTLTASSAGSGLMSKSKIRHHGRSAMVEMTPKALVGGMNSVPVRLSATEVGDDGNDDDYPDTSIHRRNMSGNGSMTSANRLLAGGKNTRTSSYGLLGAANAGPPQTGTRLSSLADGSEQPSSLVPDLTIDPGETPVPEKSGGVQGGDYFQSQGSSATSTGLSSSSGSLRAPVTEGGSSSAASTSTERENSFGEVGNIRAHSASPLSREKSVKSAEELRRRGSVDDRAMTMTNVRLFVANPDLSD